MTDQVVTKKAFASLLGVSQGAVSHYIRDGKIDGAALVGEGRRAHINVAVAQAQLKARLDVTQRMANGFATKLDGPAPAVPASVPVLDTLDDQLRRQKLRQAELQTERLEEEKRARAGFYTDARDTRDAMAKLGGAMMRGFEATIPEFAVALAATGKITAREATLALRKAWATQRKLVSDEAARVVEQEPDFIDDPHEIADEAEGAAA